MNVAMAALEASIHVQGIRGERSVRIADFHLLPGSTPHRETVLEPGDLITHVTLPPPVPGSRSLYLKLRDRASYEFALASAAVVINVEGGRIAARALPSARGHEALEIDRSRRSARRPARRPSGPFAGRRTPRCATPAPEPERLQGGAGEALPRACSGFLRGDRAADRTAYTMPGK